jgi:hypothetical protein
MDISDVTIRLIVLFIPGAIAAVIVEKLTFHRPWATFPFILYSVLMGSATYIFHQLMFYVWELKSAWLNHPYAPKPLNFWLSLFDKSIPISFKEVALSCFFAIIVGYLASALINSKLLFKTAKFFRVSMKFGDEDLWDYFLASPETGWIWVRDHSRGLVYEGWVTHVSVTPPFREILLREVKVFSNESGTFLYSVPAMYVCGKPTDLTLELPILGKEKAVYGREGNAGYDIRERTTEGRGEKRDTETKT